MDVFGDDNGYHVHIVKDMAFKQRFFNEFGYLPYVNKDGSRGHTNEKDEIPLHKYLFATSLQVGMITNDTNYVSKITWMYV